MGLLLFLLLVTAADDEPPVVGRPAHFCGAVGTRVKATLHAEPTELFAEESLTLTVRIQGVKEPGRVTRPRLQDYPDFAGNFHVEDAGQRTTADAAEFDYRLRPLRPDVTTVPDFPLDYYNPQLGRYQPTVARNPDTDGGIPLTVKARPPTPEAAVPLAAPPFLFDIVEGPAVSRHESPPGWSVLAGWLAALLVPPVLALGGRAWWRWHHPDPTRQAARRRSRAARQALQALRRPAGDEAERVAGVVARYFQEREGLPVTARTPADIGEALRQRGGREERVGEAVAFFRACDAARFAPAGDGGPGELRERAAELIRAWEAELVSHVSEKRVGARFSETWLILLLVFAHPSRADDSPGASTAADWVARAEAAFREGQRHLDNSAQARPLFRQAADACEQARRLGAANPDLFRNQGHAALLADDLAGAILAYRRGLNLAPDEPALRAGLAEARARVTFPDTPEWAKVGRPVAVPVWIDWLASGPAWCAGLLLSAGGWLAWSLRRGGGLGPAAAVVGTALLVAGALADEWRRAPLRPPVVVVAEEKLPLRRGNGTAYPPRLDAPLPRGLEARPLAERGGWLQIELAGGVVGWVPAAAVRGDGPGGG
jgi:hypothetical protein